MPENSSSSSSEESVASTETDSDEVASWLAQLKEEEERKRERQRLSEAKTVRFRADDAEHISQRANELGVSEAEFIRLMCSGRRPDMVAARRKAKRLHDLIERFTGAFTDAGKDDSIERLRHIAEEMQRQANEITSE